MTYQVPAADPGDMFEFRIGRKTYRVLRIEDLPLERIDALNAMRGMGSSDKGLRELVATLFGDEVAPAVLTLSVKQLTGLVDAWESESQVTVGESKPSGS